MSKSTDKLLCQAMAQLQECKLIIKKITEDNKTLQIKADTVDLMSCFLFAKVPDAKSLDGYYGADPIHIIDRLVSGYEKELQEKATKQQAKKIKKQTKPVIKESAETYLKEKKNGKVKSSRYSRRSDVV